MKLNPLAILPLVLLLVLAGFAFWSLWQARGAPPQSQSRDIGFSMVGQTIAPITVPAFESPQSQIALADWDGRAYAINVFASWCPPCRAEAPSIHHLSQTLPIIGINFRDEAADAAEFLHLFGNPYAAIGVDSTGQASLGLGVQAVPETLLVDPQGVIIFHQRGPVFADELTAILAILETVKE